MQNKKIAKYLQQNILYSLYKKESYVKFDIMVDFLNQATYNIS